FRYKRMIVDSDRHLRTAESSRRRQVQREPARSGGPDRAREVSRSPHVMVRGGPVICGSSSTRKPYYHEVNDSSVGWLRSGEYLMTAIKVSNIYLVRPKGSLAWQSRRLCQPPMVRLPSPVTNSYWY